MFTIEPRPFLLIKQSNYRHDNGKFDIVAQLAVSIVKDGFAFCQEEEAAAHDITLLPHSVDVVWMFVTVSEEENTFTTNLIRAVEY